MEQDEVPPVVLAVAVVQAAAAAFATAAAEVANFAAS